MKASISMLVIGILGMCTEARAQTPVPTPRPTPWAVAGPEFAGNESTVGHQFQPAIAIGTDAGFVVTWGDNYGYDNEVEARRFDKTGFPLTGDFRVNTTTTGAQYSPSIASDTAGNFVIVWASTQEAQAGADIFARRFDANGNALGDEFRVNSYTTGTQRFPDVAMNADGFIVVWASDGQDGDQGGVYAQRFGADGSPAGSEFRVNTYTTNYQAIPRVAMGGQRFVVTWYSWYQDGDKGGVFAQIYDAAGSPVGDEFQVNTLTSGSQVWPDVAMRPAGDFVVSWSSYDTGDSDGVFIRAFNTLGGDVGPELRVSTNHYGGQARPRVAVDSGLGGFVVVWTGPAPTSLGAAPNGPPPPDTSIYAQRFFNAPLTTAAFAYQQPRRRGGETQVNVYTSSFQFAPDVAVAPDGRFVVAWQTVHQNNYGEDIAARRFNFPGGYIMKVDERASGGTSNVNGVLEPGERVTVDPAWTNSYPATAPLPLTGSASNITGPPGPTYTLEDSVADYGTIAEEATSDCFTATGNCYEVTVSGDRPAPHWDATFDEALASTGPFGSAQPLSKTWALHVGNSFPDVPQDSFYPFIENLFHNNVTAGGGCGAGLYCGEDPALRQQMAVFLLKSAYGAAFTPPAATGAVFDDVPVSSPFAPWIEELARIGVTAGCTVPVPPALPSYCPTAPVSRQQMAVFLFKAFQGPNVTPADCVGIFDDVPCSSPYSDYVEYQFNTGITAGCSVSPPLYCPTETTKRKQMAAFLVKTFALQLYGPD